MQFLWYGQYQTKSEYSITTSPNTSALGIVGEERKSVNKDTYYIVLMGLCNSETSICQKKGKRR